MSKMNEPISMPIGTSGSRGNGVKRSTLGSGLGAENAGVENAGVENAGAYRRGGKCRSGKCRSDKVWKAIRKNTLKHLTKCGCRGFLA